MDYVHKKVLRFSFYDGEKYEYIKNDLQALRDDFKYTIKGFVVDGGKQIKKAIQEIYPESKLQRCLTHIKRQIQTYISKNPQSNCGKELQILITFDNFKNEIIFKDQFYEWDRKWNNFLKEKSSK